MTKINFGQLPRRELAMITPDQFDTLRSYDDTATKFKFQFESEVGSEQKNSSLIGGLIRALLWGD